MTISLKHEQTIRAKWRKNIPHYDQPYQCPSIEPLSIGIGSPHSVDDPEDDSREDEEAGHLANEVEPPVGRSFDEMGEREGEAGDEEDYCDELKGKRWIR
jgi:hypothetical protein